MVGIVRFITATEMIVSVLIALVSLVLAIYWFRYTCILLLRSRGEQPTVAPEDDIEAVRHSLIRDYRMLTYLWEHAAGLGEQSVEERILRVDFQIMRIWYYLTRTALPAQARSAITEMSAVVNFLGQKLGQQAGLEPEAIREV
jgi:hypothetical protein